MNELFIFIFVEFVYNFRLSGSNSFGVSWEQGSISNILKGTIKHDNSFKTNTSSSVREGSVSEAVNVVFDCAWVDFAFDSSLLKNLRVMDSLGATENLFTSHEEIIGAGISWVIIADCSIERTSTYGVTMEHVEISIVLFADYIR